ncbi:40S ribosomal protein S27-1, putative [Leishmania tarentolae]|uniref:40S ribosomal protein S27-1, putative n=1 Tax=Leishmania tarentolae TaxID=5689 RepID=A0A640KVR5_LEITA|nr:40S ribosomal protein S27-1, putative [Leishmania tarentolae]
MIVFVFPASIFPCFNSFHMLCPHNATCFVHLLSPQWYVHCWRVILFTVNSTHGNEHNRFPDCFIMGFFDADLSYPTVRTERMKHKRRRLVQGPNSYFMDVSCPRCRQVTVVYSHATTSVECKGCSKKLCRPTGGKALLVGGCGYRRKPEH